MTIRKSTRATTTFALITLATLSACADEPSRDAGRDDSTVGLAPDDDTLRAPRDTTAVGDDSSSATTDDASATQDSLRAALDALARGAGQTTGEFSWFSGETAQVIRAVTVDEGGRAIVDFVDLRPLIPNASTSAGSQQLLDELNATVFSVDGVTSVEYRMNGDCELLGEWLQYGVCLRFDRP